MLQSVQLSQLGMETYAIVRFNVELSTDVVYQQQSNLLGNSLPSSMALLVCNYIVQYLQHVTKFLYFFILQAPTIDPVQESSHGQSDVTELSATEVIYEEQLVISPVNFP